MTWTAQLVDDTEFRTVISGDLRGIVTPRASGTSWAWLVEGDQGIKATGIEPDDRSAMRMAERTMVELGGGPDAGAVTETR